jgi:tetratricopeptide (TPR) repeat protein
MGRAHFGAGRYDEAVLWLERSRQSRPDFPFNLRALASTYSHLGRQEDARMALQESLRLLPDETVSRTRARAPWADPDYLERYIDGLRKAGLPEGTEE